MIFSWVFLNRVRSLNENEKLSFKRHFQHWPLHRWLRQKTFEITICDPWIQKMNVTNNTIFFRHFKQGFSIFCGVFFYIKVSPFYRITDSCFFSLFTLDFNIFPFFLTMISVGKKQYKHTLESLQNF